MHRIDGPGATVDDKFTKGDPQQAIPATEVTDDWLNDIQENLATAIEDAGLALAKGDYDQLVMAVPILAKRELAHKAPVRAVVTTDITLSGEQTIDGVALVAGDRVLITGQSVSAENGIYVVTTGAWSRATDADTASRVPSGMKVPVAEGAANADSVWMLTTDGPVTLGTTALIFKQVAKVGVPDKVRHVIEQAGLVYDSGDDTQLRTGIAKLGRTFRNMIINGCFRVDQRGGASGTSEVYGLDRFFSGAGTGGTRTVTQQGFALGQTDVPQSPMYFMRHAQTVDGSSVAPIFGQRIEDVSLFSGATVTLSFWARCTAGAINPYIRWRHSNGSGGSGAPADIYESSITLTASWQKFTFSRTLPVNSGVLGASSSLEVSLLFPGNEGVFTVDIAQVQLEKGSVVTDFEQRPLSIEEQLCGRYFETSFGRGVKPTDAGGASTFADSNNVVGLVTQASAVYNHGYHFKTRKRIAPTVVLYGDSNNYIFHYPYNATTLTWDISSNFSRFATTEQLSVYAPSVNLHLVGFHFTADAEL